MLEVRFVNPGIEEAGLELGEGSFEGGASTKGLSPESWLTRGNGFLGSEGFPMMIEVASGVVGSFVGDLPPATFSSPIECRCLETSSRK